MRITLFSIFCSVLLSLAGNAVYAQGSKVTIKLDNVNINKVLSEIEKQTNYLFIYNNQLDLGKAVSVDARDQSANQILDQILSGTGISYKLEGNHVVLSGKDSPVTQQPASQTGRITGIVNSGDNTPIIGAYVMIKGTATGAVTSLDGSFSLTATPGQVIVVSYLGYQTQEVPVTNQSDYRITLSEGTEVIENVIVTALGIKREEKALSYSAQQVSSEELNIVKDVNMMNALNGKIAGAVINSSAAGIGGSSRVVLRGVKSISQSNNALYVIDGIPMFNTNNGTIENEYEAQPGGEGITDLNPDDVESMTVLTGPSAAALYGSNAAAGVIIITTKKGKSGKPQISFSNQTTFSNPLMMPKLQDTYGNAPRTYASWGAKLDAPSGYDPKDFFNTSANTQTSASISVGNDKNQTYVSLLHVYANGIIPNNKYDKYSITFRNTTSFLKDKMTLDAGFSYIESNDRNMLTSGRYYNPLTSLYTYPRGESVEDLLAFEVYDSNIGRYVQNWAWELGPLDLQNPLWQMHRNIQENKRKRAMLHLNLTYRINDWLTVAGRARADITTGQSSRKLYASTHRMFAGGNNGFYSYLKTEEVQRYGDIMATANKRWGDFSLFANLGGIINDQRVDNNGLRGPLDLINFFSTTNVNPSGAGGRKLQDRPYRQEQAVFASVEAGWKSMIYLTVTGRNEWSSTLAFTKSAKKGFFYPSVGLSGLVHEMVKLPSFISFLKLRGSWAQVGSPIPWGISSLSYEWRQGSWSTSAIRPNKDLKPEKTSSWEVGLSAKLFRNSLSIDFTYYNSVTRNQSFEVPLSGTSGYYAMWLQTGRVDNKGFELSVNYDKKWGDFSWNSNVTLSHNKNKVKELVKNHYDRQSDTRYTVDEYEVASLGGVYFIMTPGGTMGDIYSYGDIRTDQNGYVYVDPNGNISVTTDRVKLGSVLPDYNAGFRNDFSYKGINLTILFSGRFGGVVVSPTEGYLDKLGVSEATARARDEGGVWVNNGYMNAQTYFETASSAMTRYVYKADNIRLQELSVGYTWPAKWFGDKMTLTTSIVGRNLWMIYCKAPFDPETTASTGSYLQGIDYFMQPSLRSVGFNVQMKF